MSDARTASIVDALRARGYRMTPQRLAIVAEIMRIDGHIAPQDVAQRVKERIPGLNDSTVYRTLELLEGLGFLAHAHLGGGPEYHRTEDAGHVHLVCARCGRKQNVPVEETEPLRGAMEELTGFLPDFTHFAVSGLCSGCRR